MPAVFWDATARNAWMIGVLAATLFFVRALGDSSRSLADVARRVALAFVPALYGLAFAAVATVPALRARADGAETDDEERREGADRWLGVAMLSGLVAWTIARPPVGEAWRFAPRTLLLHLPAVLIVLGSALLLTAMAGSRLRARIGVLAVAGAGAVGALAGLVLTLLGFADQSMPRIASGLGFVLTSCFVALVGMLAVANPLEDRRLRGGGEPEPVTRMAWVLLPAATLVLLLIILVLAMTPMRAPA